jgi:hypothetical protein
VAREARRGSCHAPSGWRSTAVAANGGSGAPGREGVPARSGNARLRALLRAPFALCRSWLDDAIRPACGG